MTTRTIPASSETICDVCEVSCSEDSGLRKLSGHYILRQVSGDVGSPTTDATENLELCDRCLRALGTVLKKEIAKIRKKAGVSS